MIMNFIVDKNSQGGVDLQCNTTKTRVELHVRTLMSTNSDLGQGRSQRSSTYLELGAVWLWCRTERRSGRAVIFYSYYYHYEWSRGGRWYLIILWCRVPLLELMTSNWRNAPAISWNSVKCLRDHRPKHKRAYKKGIAEFRDELLFQKPESSELGDCPICCLPLQLQAEHSNMTSCCSKLICRGWWNLAKEKLQHTCPFCRILHHSRMKRPPAILWRGSKRMIQLGCAKWVCIDLWRGDTTVLYLIIGRIRIENFVVLVIVVKQCITLFCQAAPRRESYPHPSTHTKAEFFVRVHETLEDCWSLSHTKAHMNGVRALCLWLRKWWCRTAPVSSIDTS